MIKTSKWNIVVFVLFVIASSSLVMCNSDSRSEELSAELTNRVTDSLNFTGGEIQDSLPPMENETMSYPQISSINAEDEVMIYRTFYVELKHNQDSSDSISAVMAWINGSEKYIKIPIDSSKSNAPIKAAIKDGDTIILTGYIDYDSEILDKTFGLYFALFGEDDMTGTRVKWLFDIVNEEYDHYDEF